MFQLRLLDSFSISDDQVKNQFKDNLIPPSPSGKYSLADLSDLSSIHPADLENFKKILTFSAGKLEDPAEYAFGWLLEAFPQGKSLKKADIVLRNGEGVSVKRVANLKTIKLGRVESLSSFRELMFLWMLWSTLFSPEEDLSFSRITKQNLAKNHAFGDSYTCFIRALQAQKENEISSKFLEKISRFAEKENATEVFSNLINCLFKEALTSVDHLIILNSKDLSVRVISDLQNHDFFSENFTVLAGTELFFKVNG